MSRHACSYAAAIQWLVDNDDTCFMDDEDPTPSVTLCLVADIYSRDVRTEAMPDLAKALKNRKH